MEDTEITKKNPKPTLAITHTPPHYRVSYQVLEDFLAQVYRLNMNILRAAGVVHNVYPEYLVRGVIPADLQAQADRVRQGHRARLTLVLEVLCVDGHLPAGSYILDTSQPTSPLEAYKQLLHERLDPMHMDCIRFKAKHRDDSYFRKMARVIDRSLLEWLKEERA